MRPDNPLSILLVGRLPPPLGGTTVSFAQLVKELSERTDGRIEVISMTRDRSLKRIGKILYDIFKMSRSCDVVSLHATTNGTFFWGAIVWLTCKIHRKPWILRKFAGSFDQAYKSLPKPIKFLVRRTSINADLCLFQTNHLVRFFSEILKNPVAWYPNSRPLPKLKQTNRNSTARRFVFVGHVISTKGIHELIAASEKLDSSICVDIYGPLNGDVTEEMLDGLKTVRYCGVLEPAEVIPTLQTYDVLVLPSYWEGYSGAILEAYSAGIPVISTRAGGTPEIVDATSGILIEPGKWEELLEAMTRMIEDGPLLQSLRKGVEEKRGFFSSERWAGEFVRHCRSVLRNSIS